ncbi:hypothetical Protein psc1_06700 [Candidatus Phytoplasma solani]
MFLQNTNKKIYHNKKKNPNCLLTVWIFLFIVLWTTKKA